MSVNLSGTWHVNDGSSTYSVQLTQEQNHVVGLYAFPAGHHGHIDGYVKGDEFSFRWDQPSNQRAGWGNLQIFDEGHTMSGTWSYDASAYGSGQTGSGQWVFRREGIEPVVAHFHDWLSARLAAKGYVRLEAVATIQRAYMKQDVFGGHYVVGVVDARRSTESIARTFQRVEGWFANAIGRREHGVILFLYSPALATTIEEINQTTFTAGSASVFPGAYDLSTNKYWLSARGLENDLFG